MIDILSTSAELLSGARYSTMRVGIAELDLLAFEDTTKIGFLFAYANATELVKGWQRHVSAALTHHTLPLRRAGEKAWNTYVVLLAGSDASYSSTIALSGIEEDLSGTRKIARAGVIDLEDVRAALLSLLPLQSAPRLEAVDIAAEIRQRATELHPHGVDAFLSNAEESTVLQVLEEGP